MAIELQKYINEHLPWSVGTTFSFIAGTYKFLNWRGNFVNHMLIQVPETAKGISFFALYYNWENTMNDT